MNSVIKLLICCMLPILSTSINGQDHRSVVTTGIRIEDFNTGLPGVNLLQQNTGSFHSPRPSTGNSLVQDYIYVTDNNWALKLNYNVSDRSGCVGYWTRLTGLNLSNNWSKSNLVFYIKGDSTTTYTNRIKIDLKARNGNELASINVGGITQRWQRKQIPLNSFINIHSWEQMFELVFVFSANDLGNNPLRGTICIDNISIE